MKIAYMMSRFPKITETFVLFEMLEMERLGVPIEVFPLLRERQGVMHPEAQRFVERAHYHPFVSLPILQANAHFLSRRPAAYLRMLWEALSGTSRSLNFLVGALGIIPKSVRFAYEMQRLGVTHVHAHFATHPTLAALIIHRLTGIHYSFTAHGSDLHVDRTMLDRKVAAAAFAVTCSEFNKDLMVEECGEQARAKIHVIRYGVEPELLAEDVELANGNGNGNGFQIICVGSFEEVKGHKYLIEACGILRDRGISFKCDLVGDGPGRQQIEQQIAQADLADHFVLHGYRPRQEVVALLRSAHVKVAPSVPTKGGKREGMPNVLIEAMALALPVVSTRLTGIPELVQQDRTGMLAEPGDAQGLAAALQALSADAGLRARLGRAGRELVIAEYNRRNNTARLADFIRARE